MQRLGGLRPNLASQLGDFWGISNLSSQVAQWERIHLSMKEIWVQTLIQEDPLEEEMATHSSILAWRMPWTEEPGGLPSMGSQRVGYD